VLAAGSALLTFFMEEVAKPLLRRARKAQEQEEAAAEALRRHLGRREALPLISEGDPLRLGVHPAIDLPPESSNELDRRLPLYVERDLDADLRTWLRDTARRRGGFALITGGSSMGKTRFVYEAVRTIVPDCRLLAPYGDAAVVNVLGDSTLRLPKLVVWLDELQKYLKSFARSSDMMLLTQKYSVIGIERLWRSLLIGVVVSPLGGTARRVSCEVAA
jgi:hypothetical protein